MTQHKESIAEKNARASARGRYFEWLYRRFRPVRLLEMVDEEPGPVSLRQIFVPLQAGHEDMDEEKMSGPEEVREETLPGEGVWDLLVQEPFVALSGRPGSGKTTLVHALVVELCGQHSSNLRKQLAGNRGIAPIPLILRNLPDLESVRTLDELLECWWREAGIQAEDDNLRLDIPRLRDSFDRSKEAYPALLMFDGIDEVGGTEMRSRIFQMAAEAANLGFRVLVTGRPTGFHDLPELNGKAECLLRSDCDTVVSSKEKIYHVLPFAWEQIERFVRDWYTLRNDWKRKRQAGIENFLNALQDSRRRYLLTLARRPIFLTLMALVHCSRNEMPDGRGALYKAIIDLYLVRQERHRQLKETTEGKPMPHWPETEKRMVLGYLAYESQVRGSRQKKDEPEKRRMVWKREEMLTTIREQLSSRKYGRFTDIRPEDAEDLLRYFLHPAGLLTEPEEERIQFAHLSFQEYLCADFLAGRSKENYLKKELFSRLGRPGWDEVGMLLLTIRAEQERNEGHFEILSWLDLSDVHQADLFIRAYTGRELPFTERDLEEWLPVAMGCALVHPDAKFVKRLSRLPEAIQQQGIELLIQMFEAEDHEKQWDVLLDRLEKMPPFCIEDCLTDNPMFEKMKTRWLNPENDSSWYVEFDDEEARAYSLFLLFAKTKWRKNQKEESQIQSLVISSENRITKNIATWIQKKYPIHKNSKILLFSIFLSRKKTEKFFLPVITNAAMALEALVPSEGLLFDTLCEHIPLDAFILQGISSNDLINSMRCMPTLLMISYPRQFIISHKTILGLGLYQAVTLAEGASGHNNIYDEYTKIRGKYQFILFFSNRSRRSYLSLKLFRDRHKFIFNSLKLNRYRSLSLNLSMERGQKRPFYIYRYPYLFGKEYNHLKERLEKIENKLTRINKDAKNELCFYLALEHFGYQYAAHDWFDEQAENPDLMCRRGLRPGEPLPKEFGLFDNDGRPLPVQNRKNWVRLRQWLDDDDAVLEFFFPDGLPDENRENLLAQTDLLRKQPWSPQAALDAVLADWPEDEPERPYTMEHAEAQLEKACDEFLKAVGENGKAGE
ncbi:hypothetical protein DENIS_1216 [Desulfonema ishimotonii]|uniref:NACHT domain-containing protein n=1 Tax=Desulfonema ishimotonii TaxID=45657 RepID=A0A401FTH9_9BACT|nr:NACHT domain-containing protein [Desulfonema ishimotonii]GBC60265.1 hypothetical protein DENIS_1216 [Desulfonema ishimotonii]